MTPALEVAKRGLDNQVGVVCEEPCDQVLRDNPFVDELIVGSRSRKFLSRLQVIRKVRAFRPDIAIDLHGGTTSSIMTGLSGAGLRVGSVRTRYNWLFNCRVPGAREVWKRSDLHTVEDQLASLKFLGYPVEPIPPLWVPRRAEDIRSAKELLSRNHLDEGFVMIHPGAAFDTKRWQVEHFARLAIRLMADKLQVAATAGPGEEGLLAELSRFAGQDLKIIEPLSLSGFAALVSFCGVFVGNDTGSTHIATAAKKPVAVIFGSSDSKVWYPWQTDFRVIKSDLDCIPCPGYHCLEYDEPKCIRTIDVERVHQAVRDLISVLH